MARQRRSAPAPAARRAPAPAPTRPGMLALFRLPLYLFINLYVCIYISPVPILNFPHTHVNAAHRVKVKQRSPNYHCTVIAAQINTSQSSNLLQPAQIKKIFYTLQLLPRPPPQELPPRPMSQHMRLQIHPWVCAPHSIAIEFWVDRIRLSHAIHKYCSVGIILYIYIYICA